MDLTQLTLDRFMCAGNAEIAPADPDAFQNFKDILAGYIGVKLRDLNDHYTLNELGTAPGDAVLLYHGEPVGFYFGELLAIDSDHKGRGLSVPLVLEAVKGRPIPTIRKMSEPGRKALTKAWRVANGQESNPWIS